MENYQKVKIQKASLYLINQVFEIEKKTSTLQETNSIQRNIDKLKNLLEEELFKGDTIIGFSYYNPQGEVYNETRIDCEASISGIHSENLVIREVIKPIIYCTFQEKGEIMKTIVQKAVVVVAAV